MELHWKTRDARYADILSAINGHEMLAQKRISGVFYLYYLTSR